MVIKSYIAESSAIALKLARTELGPDAVILRTRQLDDSGVSGVEITACAEKVSAGFDGGPRKSASRPTAKPAVEIKPMKQPQPITPQEPAVSRIDVAELLANIETKIDSLVNHRTIPMTVQLAGQSGERNVINRLRNLDFSSEFVTTLLKSAPTGAGTEALLDYTASYIAEATSRLVAPSPEFTRGDTALFFGLAGCGVQSMMAAVSADLVTQRSHKVELLSVDLESAGKRISSDKKVTLINTPLLPLAVADLQALRFLVEQIQPTHRILVVSAMHRADDLADWRYQMAALEPTHMAVTMADRNKRFGAWLSLADALKVPVVMGTSGFGKDARMMEIDAADLLAGLVTAEETI
jgi:flagellar biosynthesis GTPase FlhF